jgi:organic radical activating enzyme
MATAPKRKAARRRVPIDPDRRRWYRARAKKAERELEAADGKTVLVSDVVGRLKQIFGAARQKILQSGLEPAEQDDLLDELEELKKNGRSFGMLSKSLKRRTV